MKPFPALVLLLTLAACSGISVPQPPWPADPSPSALPAIRSPTLPFVPSATLTLSTPQTATETLTATPTTTSATDGLVLEIQGCNTSLDLTHGMGEVTNAYPLIKNLGPDPQTAICATLSASDEDRAHPDKSFCIPELPGNHQVLIKLTVDTGFQEDTSIQVDIASQEGLTTSLIASSCLSVGIPGWIPAAVGLIEPVP